MAFDHDHSSTIFEKIHIFEMWDSCLRIKVLSLYACTSMFIESFLASGLTSLSPGCPSLTSFQDFSFFTLATVSSSANKGDTLFE